MTRLTWHRLAGSIWIASQLAGCGLGWVDNQSGGDDHLPTRAAGPYSKLPLDLETPADEPYVIHVFRVDLRDPSALHRAGGGYRLWFSYQESSSASEIWVAELADPRQLPDVGPKQVLLPDEPWEQGWVGAPCVVRVSADELVMVYQGGLDSPAIGRAKSLDNGLTWEKDPNNPVLLGYSDPALTLLPDGSWLLYATRQDRLGIFRARSTDAKSWQVDARPVIDPRPHEPDAYDRYAVSDPWIVTGETATGQVHYGLFFNGVDREDEQASVAIGWAGSFDGVLWQRFSSPDDAVLEPGGTSEHGPSVVIGPDRGVMFFSQRRQGVQSIAVAVHP
ncbi:MAG: hypothetical protein MJE77_07025 [Proteobacteria bacterium]|nr:hypothetical protein [Pseudomonadota bacterium]